MIWEMGGGGGGHIIRPRGNVDCTSEGWYWICIIAGITYHSLSSLNSLVYLQQ